MEERESVEFTNNELEVHLEELEERKKHNSIMFSEKFQACSKLNITRKKVGILAIAIIGMIVVLGMVSGGFTGGILTGEAVAPVKLVEVGADDNGPIISWYSIYVDYQNYKYLYRDVGDPIIDRNDESLQKNMVETTNYKVNLSPSGYSNRLAAISAMFKDIEGIYKLEGETITSKIESQEIIEYDVGSTCFKSTSSSDDHSKIAFSTIHLVADGITKLESAEAKIQNATAHVTSSNNEALKSQCLHFPLFSDDVYSSNSQRFISLEMDGGCKVEYQQTNTIKNLSPSISFSTCGDVSRFYSAVPSDDTSLTPSSPRYFWVYSIKGRMQHDVTPFHISWTLEYSNSDLLSLSSYCQNSGNNVDLSVENLDHLQTTSSDSPLSVLFEVRVFPPKNGKAEWDFQLLSKLSGMFSSLISSYPSLTCS